MHICIRLHILSTTANRNAVIMDALPATVVQRCEGFGGGARGPEGEERGGKAGGREAAGQEETERSDREGKPPSSSSRARRRFQARSCAICV